MFCEKCGNQISEGANVCGNCGTPVAHRFVRPNQNQQFYPNQNNSFGQANVQNQYVPGVPGQKNTNIVFYVAMAACQLLMIILWFVESIAVDTFLGIGDTWSFAEYLEDGDVGFLSTFAVIAMVVGALPSVSSFITKAPKLKMSAIAVLSNVLVLLLMIIILFLFGEYNADYDGMAEVKLTFAGIVFLVLNIAGIVLPFIMKKVSND